MLTTVESFMDREGNRWSFEIGNHVHGIFMSWHGFKTRNSRRKTWNKVLIIKGPKCWEKVSRQWEIIKRETAN